MDTDEEESKKEDDMGELEAMWSGCSNMVNSVGIRNGIRCV